MATAAMNAVATSQQRREDDGGSKSQAPPSSVGRAPLIAVCGLVGGAGATTLAYLLAQHAARQSDTPVLLAELNDHGVLAALIGRGSDHGLVGLARALDARSPIGSAFVDTGDRLRVVTAAQPSLDVASPVSDAALERVISDARAAHGLVIVDTGPPSTPASGQVVSAASQLLLVTSASPLGVARCERMAAARVLPLEVGVPTTFAVVGTHGGRASLKAARHLAECCADRLLLVPHHPALSEARLDRAQAGLELVHAAFDVLIAGQR
jgi:hypothetical protein